MQSDFLSLYTLITLDKNINYYTKLTLLLSEGFLLLKLGLPRDIEPEFLDWKDSMDIFELYFEPLPSFIC